MYINDLSENINCNIKQYTDDTKLYTTVKGDKDIYVTGFVKIIPNHTGTEIHFIGEH